MKIKSLLLIVAMAVLCQGIAAQPVTITGKKIVYKRPKPFSPEKKTFWINHPRVKAATPALSKKIQAAISFEKVIPLSVNEEINEVQWLEEADFKVDYNNNDILTVTLTIYGSGAYPSSSDKTIVVDAKSGNRVKASDIFVGLNGLAAMIRKAQEKEIAEAIEVIKKDPDIKETDPESLFADANYTAADLKEFAVSDKGVTFIYDYGFPHVIEALQPDGKYFFSWAELKPFIKPAGLLTRVAR
jgi:hypothetical protein